MRANRRPSRAAHSMPSRDRWIIPYADFVTLLFACFAALYAATALDARSPTAPAPQGTGVLPAHEAIVGAEHDNTEQVRSVIEDALRDALGKTCPTCGGEGRVSLRRLRVTNVRREGIGRLQRHEALELQRVFRLGQEVAATRLELRRHGRRVGFTLRRERTALLNGVLEREASS